MEHSAIAGSLAPFLGARRLNDVQLEQVSRHLDLLLKWNAKINLTSVRDPQEMLRRHFGESFFAATKLFPETEAGPQTMIDFGSGAGFPGIPIKILLPELHIVLIESRNKKATFLREVIRALALKDIQVQEGRAEKSGLKAGTVTMRAVEKFEESLTQAAELVAEHGRLALFIGSPQVEKAKSLLPELRWREPAKIPGSEQRVLVIGVRD